MKINKKGFTLIELLVVIAIIGLLSTLAVVSLNSARTKARDARRQSDLKQVSTAMELYASNQSSSAYPIAGTCGAAGVIAAAAAGLICPPGNAILDAQTPANTYLASIPEDPTNDATYYYRYGTGGSALSYCLSAQLETEANTWFKCTNGSCRIDTSACP